MMSGGRMMYRHALVVGAVAAIAMTGCSGGSGDTATDRGLQPPRRRSPEVDNFIEDPLLAQAIVDKMVDPDTPITSLTFNQETVSVQERGQTDAYVVFRAVGEGELGPTTTVADPGSDADKADETPGVSTEEPTPTQTERGATVLRSEMTPEEFDKLSAELVAIDERNAQVLSEEAVDPLRQEGEPYRFGVDAGR